ncbi:MAG: 50S ribosomal protein L4 [Clostridia bacterium]|jgi:large subunit ribosomal protein L4|nr:50S ribosomal protein L4 [Clostridia bacterium]
MAKVKVYNMQASEIGQISLPDALFAADYNEALIHEVVVAYNANQRQGTKSALTRSEVRGHAKKPWRQKGTGRARQGSKKGPQWTGGGVVFAPKPRDFSKKVNKQKKRGALVSALSQKLAQNEVTVLDKFEFSAPKTKEAQAFLNAFKFDKSVLVINDSNDKNVKLATANIKTLSIAEACDLNVYELVANKNIVITESAIKSLEEAYAE